MVSCTAGNVFMFLERPQKVHILNLMEISVYLYHSRICLHISKNIKNRWDSAWPNTINVHREGNFVGNKINLQLTDRKKVIIEAHFEGLSQNLQGHKSCCFSDNKPQPLEPLKPCVVIFSHSDWKELWWVGKRKKKEPFLIPILCM